ILGGVLWAEAAPISARVAQKAVAQMFLRTGFKCAGRADDLAEFKTDWCGDFHDVAFPLLDLVASADATLASPRMEVASASGFAGTRERNAICAPSRNSRLSLLGGRCLRAREAKPLSGSSGSER